MSRLESFRVFFGQSHDELKKRDAARCQHSCGRFVFGYLIRGFHSAVGFFVSLPVTNAGHPAVPELHSEELKLSVSTAD